MMRPEDLNDSWPLIWHLVSDFSHFIDTCYLFRSEQSCFILGRCGQWVDNKSFFLTDANRVLNWKVFFPFNWSILQLFLPACSWHSKLSHDLTVPSCSFITMEAKMSAAPPAEPHRHVSLPTLITQLPAFPLIPLSTCWSEGGQSS